MNEGKHSMLIGNVEYRMKHIRLQNRHLKFHKAIYEKPKHIRFDDEGNPIPEEAEDEVIFSKANPFIYKKIFKLNLLFFVLGRTASFIKRLF